MFKSKYRSNIYVAGIFCLLLTTYHLIFRNFFPLPNGLMGHDYTLTLAGLLDGYLWYRNNGFITPPWFTPSFCGGQAFFSDPQSIFYSVPQFLSFIVAPLQAVYWAFLIFAGLGFWGMYLFARANLKIGQQAAIIAAAIFMFNGFYAQRMIIGHYGFQSFTLVPFITYLLLNNSTHRIFFTKTKEFAPLSAGILIAYWFHSGMTTLMIPAAISVLALACLVQIRTRENLALGFVVNGLIAAATAIGLSISKLNANLTLMGNFTRDYYLLPGISEPTYLVTFVFQSLFYSSEHVYQMVTPHWKNLQWAAMPHELAYSLGPISLSLLIVGLGSYLLKLNNAQRITPRISWNQRFAIVMLALIGLLPFALLYYSPYWNEVLKSLPLIGSTTSPFRWLIILIPAIAALTGIASEMCGKHINTVMLAVLVGIPALNALEERSYYQTQNYNPTETVNYYNAVQLGEVTPKITTVGSQTEHNGQIAAGVSPARCYNPLYGYRQEKLRVEPLIFGSVSTLTSSESLNLHNPACLVFPLENKCKLWDAFKPSQSSELQAFASYKPYTFEKSVRQHVADWISLITCFALIIAALVSLFRHMIKKGTS